MTSPKKSRHYLEALTRCATGEYEDALKRLSARELRTVFANRAAYTRLMLSLAVKLEAGVKPGAPVK